MRLAQMRSVLRDVVSFEDMFTWDVLSSFEDIIYLYDDVFQE